MLTRRNHRSGVLFDPWTYLDPQVRKLLERGWAGVFRDYLLRHLPVQELAAGFRDDFGRSSKDLTVALGALILQQLHDDTDQQTTEAVAMNIAWHYALDIRHESDAYLRLPGCNQRRRPLDPPPPFGPSTAGPSRRRLHRLEPRNRTPLAKFLTLQFSRGQAQAKSPPSAQVPGPDTVLGHPPARVPGCWP